MKVSENLPLRPFINHAQICTGIRRNLEEQFSRVLSQDLHWENRTYELKRTIARQLVTLPRVKRLSVTKMSLSFGGLGLILQTSTTHVDPDQEAG